MSGTLLIRADATAQIGTGHVMRCFALAQAWKKHSGNVFFISYCENQYIQNLIKHSGIDFIKLESPFATSEELNDTFSVIENIIPKSHDIETMTSTFPNQPSSKNATWVVVDGYHFHEEYINGIHNAGFRTLVIDDMAHLPYYHADIVLNQNIHADVSTYRCDKNTTVLAGNDYVLLRSEFLSWKNWKKSISQIPKTLLVTSGGSDYHNVNLKVIKAIQSTNVSNIVVYIIAGPSNPYLALIKKELKHSVFSSKLLHHVENMPELMARADLCISAGGSTCWELAFMGVPTLVVVTAENQINVAEGLLKNGAAINLGWHEKLSSEDISAELTNLIQSEELRNRISHRARQLIDGNGIDRVLRCMLMN
ncbi:MAG: UDP-2,4-diacetamido-2,4,6-trideoxy-beta-L-altropyranose hydrolase [Desulfobacterales bacterium]|nr:UDP-2,4-diacetamido-2,4,6-trideoxy-beta-L-altropyranose hydrolase [Desulfobacterales bacterium]